MTEAWGPEITSSNLQADQPNAIRKYAERFLSPKDLEGDQAELPKKLQAIIARMELDPEVTGRTLGRPIKNMDASAIMDVTKKLLSVSRRIRRRRS